MYQYDPNMAPAFNQRMAALDAQGRGDQIGAAYAQAANGGVAPAQPAMPAPTFQRPAMTGFQSPRAAGFAQRTNPLMQGGDPRSQTLGYMLRGQQMQAPTLQRQAMPQPSAYQAAASQLNSAQQAPASQGQAFQASNYQAPAPGQSAFSGAERRAARLERGY